MEAAKAVPITERLRKIKIGSYTVDEGSHSKHIAVRAICEEAADEIERLKSERAILRDSAKDVIAWCDANPQAGDAPYCITRLHHAIVATEAKTANVEVQRDSGSIIAGGSAGTTGSAAGDDK